MHFYELFPSSQADINCIARAHPELNPQIRSSAERANDENNYPAQTLLDDAPVIHVCTESIDNSYYDFMIPNYYFSIKNYTFQTGERWITNGLYPVHWKVEGYTGRKWVKIGEVKDLNPGMNTKKTQTFEIHSTLWFKAIRFTHIGLAYSQNGYNFCLYKFDAFGLLMLDKIYQNIIKQTCKARNQH